ncbi:MAG: hypothetical protein KKB79_00700 [Nanoarchaeota archaeon]|nr:hypothetical protein [Nanoarchaeota archaeon]
MAGYNFDNLDIGYPVVVLDIRYQKGFGNVSGFYIAEELMSKSTLSVNPADYELVPNTFVNGKEVYVRK